MRITNRTDARVTLEGIAVENTNFVQPSVRGGVNYTVRDGLDQTPEVLVETSGTGDVHVSGIISQPPRPGALCLDGRGGRQAHLLGTI